MSLSFPGNDDESPWASDAGGATSGLATSTVVSSSASPIVPDGAVSLDETEILADETLSEDDKKQQLQRLLFYAASNGDAERVHGLLGGDGRQYVEVDARDNSGSTALVYAACFGHEHVASELLRYGADPDVQDQHEWTALMWAINNHHLPIVERLMENGASLSIRTSTNRTALDFVAPDSDIGGYLRRNGYTGGDDGDDDGKNEPDDFYQRPVDPAEFEEELSREQMILQSSIALDVPLAHLDGGMDDEPNAGWFGAGGAGDEADTGDDGQPPFVWDRCLPDQMFVFADKDIPKVLDLAITQMVPQRSHAQKPVPANTIFLGARYAHYFGSPETLQNFLEPALQRIRAVVLEHQSDLAFQAFWLSNCSLLLYYMRRDPGLTEVTADFQQRLSELISDIYVLMTRDVETRLDRVLDASILDHETIPGLNDIQFRHEWRLFRSKAKPHSAGDDVKQVTLPPSMEQKMKPSPRNVTSILSSTLFVLDLYDVHPIITQEVVSQVLYWLGAVMFNRIMSNRKYLARSRAMQIRLNVSAIEDWARNNNRRPEDADEFHVRGSAPVYASVLELARQHLAPVTEILQWLQCFTGFGDDFTNVVTTLQQLKNINPQQLIHVAKKYRPEVGEKSLSSEYRAYLNELAAHYDKAKDASRNSRRQRLGAAASTHKAASPAPEPAKKDEKTESNGNAPESSTKDSDDATTQDKHQKEAQAKAKDSDTKDKDTASESKPESKKSDIVPTTTSTTKTTSDGDATSIPTSTDRVPVQPTLHEEESEDESDPLFRDASIILPFVIPTLREMIVTWGAGLGGINTKRARRYEPSLPEEFLEKFETDGTETTLNPVFADIAPPQATVHKGWGEDPEIDEMNGAWS